MHKVCTSSVVNAMAHSSIAVAAIPDIFNKIVAGRYPPGLRSESVRLIWIVADQVDKQVTLQVQIREGRSVTEFGEARCRATTPVFRVLDRGQLPGMASGCAVAQSC